MKKKDYDEKILREYKKNIAKLPNTLEKFASKFNLKFNKKKFENLKYQKSFYYDNAKFSDLINSFVICYTILCVKGQINLSKRIEELTHTKGYDTDVITILCILKKIYSSNGEKISNADLILLWGLLFDKDVYKVKRQWNEKMRKFIKHQKLPVDYVNFFKEKDDKYLRKNSFQKYQSRLDVETIKNYMIKLFEELDTREDISLSKIYVSELFNSGFYIYVNNLHGMIFPRLEENNLTNNFDKILNLYSKGVIESQFKSNNSKVLDYIYKNCREIFMKSFY